MRLLILHHDDLDGEASASVVIGAAHANADVGCVPMNYKDPVPLNMMPDVDEVYIVDFSLGQQQAWAEAIDASRKLTWIDHHGSAIRNAPPEAHALPGIRAEGAEAGCLLTWRHFFPESPVPRALKLISDYDTWTHALPEARAFNAGLKAAYDTRPCEAAYETWGWLLWADPYEIETDETACVPIICIGERIITKTALRNAGLVAAWGFDVEFEGLRGIALNRNQIDSDAFDSVAADYDLLLPFIFDGRQYTVSIYRGGRQPDFDCSKLAERFGGGGHPGASGFQCEVLPWQTALAATSP